MPVAGHATYLLEAGGRKLGCVEIPFLPLLGAGVHAVPIVTTVTFEFSGVGMAPQFYSALNSGSHMPIQNWSLVSLGRYAEELARWSWNHTRVDRLLFPPALQTGAGLFVVRFAVTGLRQSDEKVSKSGAHVRAYTPYDKQPLLRPAWFVFTIDGLEEACSHVSEVTCLALGQEESSFVIRLYHETSADPFRDWLQQGNMPKSGSLQYLILGVASGSAIFKVSFSGLQVVYVVPAVTMNSLSSGEVRLSFSGVSFGPAESSWP